MPVMNSRAQFCLVFDLLRSSGLTSTSAEKPEQIKGLGQPGLYL
jgi:hypothetical protein